MTTEARRYGTWDGAGARCPECGARVANVQLSFGEELIRLLGGPPIRQPRAEREGVRAYRAGRRSHGPHHADDRLAAERHDAERSEDAAGGDHRDVAESRLDTWCPGCGTRLRLDLAQR